MYQIANEVPARIFRAYDIRGVVGEGLSENSVYTLGLAIGTYAQSKAENEIFVARDGRLSGPSLQAALIQGLRDSGCDVTDIGAVPTPLLYFAVHNGKANSGIMLTGSHNPSNYNGLKIVIAGSSLTENEIQTLYQIIQTQNFTRGEGSLNTLSNVAPYCERILNDITLAKPLKVVVDCGNGIAAAIAPQLFQDLGCEIIPLHCEVDGNFPNHHPDPSVAKNMEDLQASVLENKADLGLAFDGDGDRLGVITNRGEIIWPDRLMMLYAQDILQREPGATIVYDVKCSNHLAKVIQKANGTPVMYKTGHSLIKSKMREVNAALAGEMSGHIFFYERWFGFDDALYSGCRLLEILADRDQSCADIFDALPNSVCTPEITIPIADDEKFSFVQTFAQHAEQFADATINYIDGVRVEYNDGWGLLRASNTTPMLSLRYEADNQSALDRIQALFQKTIEDIKTVLHS